MKVKKTIFFSILSLLLIISSITPVYAQNNSGVKVYRDEYGVPHIYANNMDDLYKAYGYVMAQDRLFQLEMFKRANEGTASSIFGEEYLEHDEKVRRDGYSDAEVQKMINDMDPFAKNILENFAKGIDKYVEEALKQPKEKLSKEFKDYNMEPERWTGVEVLRLYMASMTGFMDQEQELTNAQILAELAKKYGEEKAKKMFNDIFWLNDPAAPTSSNSKAASGSGTPFGVQFSNNAASKAGESLVAKRSDFDRQTEELGVPLKIGSNAVIIGSSKSKSANPIMFGGPQVGFTAPGFIYEVGLHGPDIDIQGSSFIGYPFIMFGSTQNFSFTATAGFSDVVDIYEEQLNPKNPSQYLYNGKWTDFKKRTEPIKVRQKDGSSKTVKKDLYFSVHGPVIFKDDSEHVAYTKKWSFRGTEADSWAAYLKMNYSDGIKDFETAANEYTMSLNWYYADRKKNIGYFHTGKYPIRDKRTDWRLPTPGTGEYEWKGFRNSKENPFEINPKRGFVANWNNKPAPEWNNNEQTFRWGADNRVQEYINGITKRNLLTMEDINEVNYDASFKDLKAIWFKPFLLNVLDKQDSETYKKAYDLLNKWNGLNEDTNGDGYYDSSAGLIMETWWKYFVQKVIKDDLGDDLFNNTRGYIDHGYGNGLLLRLVQGDKAALKTEYDWLNGQSIQKIALESFDEAIAQLENNQGKSMLNWKKPIQTMTFGEQSLVGVPHGLGDQKPIIFMNRGSENHFVEMAPEGPMGMNVTPPGQIGFVSQNGKYSQHYRDQIELFVNFKYKPMLFKKKDVKKHAVDIVTLTFNKENEKK
ncbi:penicillin acylase family protein [Bacillus massiliigorillae]|uniref:penicillin acylase family protein n=1 Tax=Bacillus massiliigorillae TaxID=1243664 RepID=UPI0003A92E0B